MIFCQCYVTVTMFCNNVSVNCNHVIVTGYVLIGEIACNKYPVLLLLLLLLHSTSVYVASGWLWNILK